MKTVECTGITVYGRVQGVGFRFYTHRKAVELGIKGFVQNLPDGSVYIEGEGEHAALSEFISWCRIGPAWARVIDVKISTMPPIGYQEFKIK